MLRRQAIASVEPFLTFALIGTYTESTRGGVGMGGELDLDTFGGSYSEAELQRMNERFVAAMGAAIRALREHPPGVGIDQTPGTKKPTCYVVSSSEVRQRDLW